MSFLKRPLLALTALFLASTAFGYGIQEKKPLEPFTLDWTPVATPTHWWNQTLNGTTTTAMSTVGNDTGTTGTFVFDSRLTTGAAITTRPTFVWSNFGTAQGTVSALGAWTVGPVGGAASTLTHTFQNGGGIDIVNFKSSSTSNASYLQFIQGASTLGYVGLDAGNAMSAGTANGDLVIMSNNKNIMFSGNNGTSIQGKMDNTSAWTFGASGSNVIHTVNGGITAVGTSGQNRILHQSNSAGVENGFQVNAFSSSGSPIALMELNGGRGTIASPTAVSSGDVLGNFRAGGYRSNGGAASLVIEKASIKMFADENWTAGTDGTRMEFQTTLNGSTSPSTRVTIGNDGTTTVAGVLSVTGTGNRFKAPDGTSSLPSYGFNTDGNTGINHDTANTVDFYSNGVKKMTVGTNGAEPLVRTDGTAGSGNVVSTLFSGSLTNGSNAGTLTLNNEICIRVGNWAHCDVHFTNQCTGAAASLCTMNLTIPFRSSNFTAVNQAAGTCRTDVATGLRGTAFSVYANNAASSVNINSSYNEEQNTTRTTTCSFGYIAN